MKKTIVHQIFFLFIGLNMGHNTINAMHEYAINKYRIDNLEVHTIKKPLNDNLNNHITEELYQCNQCNQKFVLKGSLTRHTRIHNISEEEKKPYPCNQCDKRFCFQDSLTRHAYIHVTHEYTINNNRCNDNLEVRTIKKPLNDNLKSHITEEPYKCLLCDKEFVVKGSLTRHLRSHNIFKEEKKPYQCNQCDKKFSSQGSLTRHAHIHGEKKIYACALCPKSYDLKNSFHVHAKRHRDQGQQLSCPLCNKKTYTSKDALDKHIKTVHEEKLYLCTICPKKFAFKSYLKKHMKIHSNIIALQKPITEKQNTPLPIQEINSIPMEEHLPLENLPLEYSPFEVAIQENFFTAYKPQLEWTQQ